MNGSLIFAPLLPLPVFWAAVGLSLVFLAYATFRSLSGWWLRGIAFGVLLIALANPSLQSEDREALSDIVIVVVDESASQMIGDRPVQAADALANIEREIGALGDTELRIVRVGDADGNQGTLLMSALTEALAGEPHARIAGVFLITDGQLHDVERAPDVPAPAHVVLSGEDDDWDRRLIIKSAPAFAVLGEPVSMILRVEDQGRVPDDLPPLAELDIAVDGGEPESFQVPVGQDLELPVNLPHGGLNVLQFTIAASPGELTDRNNSAVIQINGVRDRLRVLLVSGEPHSGERTWRNLLKSDSSVDLVHFTILRPPEKQDGVPVNELSLIAFPTRELFLDKIDDFDLIIFDRYKRRGILPAIYLDNIRQYVEGGGAVLVAAGPDFATADSIYRSPLGDIMPGSPSGRVIEEGYLPRVSEIGERHPVTEALELHAPSRSSDDDAPWGRWLRLIDLVPSSGHVVMEAMENRPLLVLDRVGEGRIALLGSDHAWLWSRGYEGGGPQLELLRRLAHWMMKEPELEEEALTAAAEGQSITINRRTLEDAVENVEVVGPDGTVTILSLSPDGPGRFAATFDAPDIGLYRLSDGDREAVVAIGPSSPREFEATIASAEALEPVADRGRGGILPISAGNPDIRRVRPGRPAAGRGWAGITPRGAYVTADISVTPALPPWAFLLLASLLAIGAWLWEGRRSRKTA